jgi:ligand-binding sensor domain-containing protein/signal transduction histidine kinase
LRSLRLCVTIGKMFWRVVFAAFAVACCPCASALNPSLDINQYAHKSWTARDGFFKGIITSIAQTPDGYLWLGSEFGLLRFDGVQSVPWLPPEGEHLPGSYIRNLMVARNGRLWIATRSGIASWKDGKLTKYPELAGQDAYALLEDHEGTVWAGVAPGRLCAIRGGSAQCYGEDGSFGPYVQSIYEDSGGNLWVGAATGLWRWKPGSPQRYRMPVPAIALAKGDNGALLIATQRGLKQLVDGKIDSYPLPGAGREFTASHLLWDRNGGLWIRTAQRGLMHVHHGRTDAFGRSDGLSGDYGGPLFEDREGNIWVASINGLDRFRDFAVPTVSVKQGLSNDSVMSVLAARDGSVWLGTIDGLNRWNNGQVTIYNTRSSGLPGDKVESIYQDGRGRIWVSTDGGIAWFENGRFNRVSGMSGRYVYSMAGDTAGNLWISHLDQGLFRLLEGRVVEHVPWARLGRNDRSRSVLSDPVQGGIWLGFSQGGLAYFKDGQVRASYATGDGLGEGFVADVQLDRDGTLWAATQGGLSRVKNGRVATLTSKNGLPCDTVHWAMEDDDHSLWLYMACGLVRISRPELEAWFADPKRTVRPTVFDSSDGVTSHSISAVYSPSVAKSTDGKLWFLPFDGVSVIDPRHLPFNKLPPPVHIEEVKVDGKDWDASRGWRLPALTRDLEIHYTALSFIAPEKNRFKYKLEGHDPDWKDAGNERKASYNDLPPRKYRFRVMASNNNGVWNEAGDSLDFSIAPAYYQTTWFRASCVAAFFVLLWALYRYRLYQIAREFNARLEERVGERTRIARDFHDTTLQNFLGVMMKFSAVKHLIPERPDVQETLEGVCEQARQAIAEGRDVVQGLRSSMVVANDLASAISTLGEGLVADHTGQNCPEFRVHVEGKSRDLPPLVRDEVYRIAVEAVRNAFRHAQAKRIEVRIRYDQRQFRLQVRDNGKGIDQAVLSAGGREGHHGLPGIHERAQLAGGKLSVRSQLDSGTEIELIIPAALAYAKTRVATQASSSGSG